MLPPGVSIASPCTAARKLGAACRTTMSAGSSSPADIERGLHREDGTGQGDERIVLVRFGPEADLDVHRRGAELGDDGLRGRIVRDTAGTVQRGDDEVDRVDRIVLVGDTDHEFEASEFVVRLDSHDALVHVAVRDEDQLAVEGPDLGLADRDGLDGARLFLHLDLVAGTERLSKQQQDTREGVLEDVLKGKADGHREEAQSGEEVHWFH